VSAHTLTCSYIFSYLASAGLNRIDNFFDILQIEQAFYLLRIYLFFGYLLEEITSFYGLPVGVLPDSTSSIDMLLGLLLYRQ
jgi:hypothetical protein